MKKETTLIVLCSVLGGCKSGAEGTFLKMRESACNADIPGFFSHVDKTSVGDTAWRSVIEEMGADASAEVVAGAEAILQARNTKELRTQRLMTNWEDEIKKGHEGALCKMSFVSASETGEIASVEWKTASGKDKTFGFTRRDGRWLVTELKQR